MIIPFALMLAAGQNVLLSGPYDYVTSPVIRPIPRTPAQIDRQYRKRLLDLRQTALDLRARDGGELSPEHHDALQDKLDAINAEHRRVLHNNRPYDRR